MTTVSTYLNFSRETEAAFNFYRSVFGGEFDGQGIMRFKDIPQQEGMPPPAKEDEDLIINVALTIMGCHTLMGTDSPDTMGFQLIMGNNVHICLSPKTRTETRELFDKLSEGGKIIMELQDMFWGDYYGNFVDRFGVQWMFNCQEKA